MSHLDTLLSSYDYQLSESHIAQTPSFPAHHAKMMVCSLNPEGRWKREDQHFFDLPKQLDERYLLFLNRTKVFKARISLKGVKILRKSGKEVLLEQGEIFVYAIHSRQQFECLVSDSKNFRPGAEIFFDEGIHIKSLAFTEQGLLFEIGGMTIFDFLEKLGEMPLPPYIHYEKEKEVWYQTFFAEEIGSAAAPTASLHFTPELVKQLAEKKV